MKIIHAKEDQEYSVKHARPHFLLDDDFQFRLLIKSKSEPHSTDSQSIFMLLDLSIPRFLFVLGHSQSWGREVRPQNPNWAPAGSGGFPEYGNIGIVAVLSHVGIFPRPHAK